MKELEHLTQIERVEAKLDIIHANQKANLEALRWLMLSFGIVLAINFNYLNGISYAFAFISLSVVVEEFLLLNWKRDIINKYKEAKK